MKQMEEMFIGQIFRVQKTVDEEDLRRWNRLVEESHVRQEGIRLNPALVQHLLCEGLIYEAISREYAGRISGLVKKELIFLLPVKVGEKMTAEVEAIDVDLERGWLTEKVTCMNSAGKEMMVGQMILKIKEYQIKGRNQHEAKQ